MILFNHKLNPNYHKHLIPNQISVIKIHNLTFNFSSFKKVWCIYIPMELCNIAHIMHFKPTTVYFYNFIKDARSVS